MLCRPSPRKFCFFDYLKDVLEGDYDITISVGDINSYDFSKIKKYIKKDTYRALGNHDVFFILENSGVFLILIARAPP